MSQMTVLTLMKILDRAAGSDESVDLTLDVANSELDDLGYESLAILEAAGLIEREYGVALDETALFDARTPSELIAVVNNALAAVSA